jgi:hypothetical protein
MQAAAVVAQALEVMVLVALVGLVAVAMEDHHLTQLRELLTLVVVAALEDMVQLALGMVHRVVRVL